jgi:hypothetical protein
MIVCNLCDVEKDNSCFYKHTRQCKECKSNIYKSKMSDDIYREKRRKLAMDRYGKEKDIILERKKRYNKKIESKVKRNKHIKKRMSEDPLYKMSIIARNNTRYYLKKRGYKISMRTQELLGCSIDELVKFLEERFESWMTWDNHGLYSGEYNYGWDIDHKIPLCSATNEEELIKLLNFANLQPLCSKINRYIKKDKTDYVI